MSEAQSLSAKQQRRTLSNAKKKKKAPIRNVYGHPRNDNWPVLCPEEENIILNLLRELLPAYRDAHKLNIMDIVSDSTKGDLSSSHIDHRDELVVGLRKVVKEIESGSLKCLLLANQVDPPSLGFILGNAAAAHNIPVVTLSNLKNTIEELLGFKSWCVGFKVSSKHFDPIFNKIESILPNLQPMKIQEETSSIMENDRQKNCGGAHEGKTKNITDLYFYRSDKCKRMFVPESCQNQSQNNSKDLFLSFSKDSSDDVIYQKVVSTNFKNSGLINKLKNDSKQRKQHPRYFEKVQLLPLQIKRFQDNPNKQKWKKSMNRSSENIQKTD